MPAFDFMAAAEALIATPSVSSMGNQALLDLLEPLALRAGMSSQRFSSRTLGSAHANLLVAHPGNPRADGGLLLCTHTDTVDPGALDAWTATQGDPYRMVQEEDRVYGLGSADVKLDALCKLLALDRLRDRTLTRPVHLLCTYAEEVGLVGARDFMSGAPLQHAYASAGEPSELRIVHAHKGYMVIRVILEDPHASAVSAPAETIYFSGVSAHSSTPHLGESAIEALLDRLVVGASRRGPLPTDGVARTEGGRGLGSAEVRRALGGCLTKLSGGEVANRVADRCELELGGEGFDGSALLAAVSHLRAEWCSLVAAMRPSEDLRFEPAYSVYNLGRIRIGSSTESPGASCEVLFDCRVLPGQDAESTATQFGEAIEAHCKERRILCSYSVDRDSRALDAPPKGPLIEAAQRAAKTVGTNPTPITKATSTEAGILASKGAQAMVFGPGVSIGNVHRPNEYNLYSQLNTAIDFYTALIQELCA